LLKNKGSKFAIQRTEDCQLSDVGINLNAAQRALRGINNPYFN